MLCPRCGYYAENEENVCPECGEIILTSVEAPPGGAEAIRQGKRARQAIHDAAARQNIEAKRRRRSGASHATVEMPAVKDEREESEFFPDYTVSEASDGEEDGNTLFERRRRAVYDENEALEEQARVYTQWIEQNSRKKRKMVNWIKISILLFAAAVVAVAGGWLFLKKTDSGQRVMARLGKEATSSALWTVGEDLMNSGDLNGAIESFEKAKEQDKADGEGHVDVDGLLMLGSAYEAAGRTEDAANLYEEIYKGTPSRPEAYINRIRILMNSGVKGDKAKAGDLMKEAYKNTGEAIFLTQRQDLLPAPPELAQGAGSQFSEKKITINFKKSSQEYQIYYTFDEEAKLPADGILFTEPFTIDEKEPDPTWNLRAVAVNGELVSDEISATYKIIMPSPQMPRCNLAPGTYKNRQKVKLFPGKDNENDDDIKIFYSVDGSDPSNGDNPEYTGEPVLLPSGHKVTIRAVAVNRYDKVSSVLEVSFKIDAKPYPLKAWEITETINGLELNKTTLQDFQASYGEGKEVEIKQGTNGFTEELRKFEYPWGYAVMTLNRRNWVLVELRFHDGSTFKAPRGTGIGDPMDFVISKFRDMGQVATAKGNRGLYCLDNGSDGKYLKKSNAIRYRIRKDQTWYQLEYHLDSSGTVEEIVYRYIPE